jgi:hypothetical protein
MKNSIILLTILLPGFIQAQINASLSDPNLKQILLGNYQASSYQSSQVIEATDQISCELLNLANPDTLELTIKILSAYHTRHTFSDTVSTNYGIGAARRWVKNRLQSYSDGNEQRMQVGYFNFDITSNACGSLFNTKNVIAILPGIDTILNDIILLTAHLDSRCEQPCNINCLAAGADDNGSGTALVMELARVLSSYSFKRTIVFMLTTGEEQGLIGARAFSNYCAAEGIQIKGVLNNDIVGGTICGETASPPGCSSEGDIDSTTLRIYSNPLSERNPHQGYARAVKLNYEEKIKPNMKVKMDIDLINQEDRSGRGGDHIAFRENDYLNLRFTSAHEHGNGNPIGTPNYRDHQHTSQDLLGEDFNNDGIIDSFYVDMNYLARNVMINGSAVAMLAAGPDVPNFILHNESTGLRLEITDPNLAAEYRLGVKGYNGSTYDSIYRFSGNSFVVPSQVAGQLYLLGLAAIDSSGLMGAFSQDERASSQTNTPAGTLDNMPYSFDCNLVSLHEASPLVPLGIQLADPQPNPFERSTALSVWVKSKRWVGSAELKIYDSKGQLISSTQILLADGLNSLSYEHNNSKGLFYYAIEKAGARTPTKRMLIGV